QIEATVTATPDAECWSTRDALLIRLCDELHETATVSDPLWSELAEGWSRDQLLELVVTAGWYRLLSYVINAAGVELEPWAAHFHPELGGQGFGQVKLGLMHEILGTSPYAPFAFGNQAPDSGNSEILALAGTEEQKERWLYPLLEGDLRSAFSMTEPETAG